MRTKVCIVMPTCVPGIDTLPAKPAAIKRRVNKAYLVTEKFLKAFVTKAYKFEEVNNFYP
jgi:hypothetical protein